MKGKFSTNKRRHKDWRDNENPARSQAHRSAGAQQRGEIRRDNSLLMGRNALREVLKHAPERLARVLCVQRGAGEHSDHAELLQQLRELEIPVEFKSADELSALTGSDAHQSFAAVLRGKEALGLKDFLATQTELDHSLVLLLDGLEDPQNLGTILRAAECFGAAAVIWARNRTVSVTPAVRKASVGASELVTQIEVGNLVDALIKLKEHGFWVVGAEARPGAVDADRFEFPKKCALVVGAEGVGLHDLVSKKSDFKVQIALHGKIDSLNVSQATAVLLHAYRRFYNAA